MQATYATLEGYLGITDRTPLRASCPLEGGGASEGSTCGVVSGGCLALVIGHLGDILSGEEGTAEAMYARLKEYTSWFEREFGSTLCRERTGVEVKEPGGFAEYLVTGKFLTRCVYHIGRAVFRLVELVEEPLRREGGAGPSDGKLCREGGYCAAEVLRGIREKTGLGSLFLEQISTAFDGGVGLSGGLCGALAGAMLAVGEVWGLDPRSAGLPETFRFFIRGHINLYMGRREAELWAVANPMAREFQRRFGSLECRDLTGRAFASGGELAEFAASSSLCGEIKDWCRSYWLEEVAPLAAVG